MRSGAAGHRPSAGNQRSASSARLSASTLTRGSPRNPSERSSVCSSTSASTRARSRPRTRATRGAWRRALAGGDVGVEARARGRHGIHRDGRVPREAVQFAVRGDALLRSRRAGRGWSGRGSTPELDCAVVPVAGGRGTGLEPLRARERLAEQRRADDDAVALGRASRPPGRRTRPARRRSPRAGRRRRRGG